MFKQLLFITIFFFNVIVTFQRSIPEINNFTISMFPNGFEIYWLPIEIDAANPIIGYKVKVWEMKKFKKHQTEDELGIIEYQEIDYEKFEDLPDYEPAFYTIVPKSDNPSARIEGTTKGVYYLVRVQGYSAAGDEPWSSTLGLRDGPPNYHNPQRVPAHGH